VELGPHGAFSTDVEAILGHFADVSWAYRFGPPGQDLVAVSLSEGAGSRLISQAFRFPVGRPVQRLSLERLGLEGRLAAGDGGARQLTLRSRAFAYGVRVQVDGHAVSDDAFGIEPGHERTVELTPLRSDEPPPSMATVTAINLEGGSLRVTAG
jgi:beta-mannosidase